MFVRSAPTSINMIVERSFPINARISANASVSSDTSSSPACLKISTYFDTNVFGAAVTRTRVEAFPPSALFLSILSMIFVSSATSSSGIGISFFACASTAAFNSFSFVVGTFRMEENTDEIGNADTVFFAVVLDLAIIFLISAAVPGTSLISDLSSASAGRFAYAYVIKRARPFSFFNSTSLMPPNPISIPR